MWNDVTADRPDNRERKKISGRVHILLGLIISSLLISKVSFVDRKTLVPKRTLIVRHSDFSLFRLVGTASYVDRFACFVSEMLHTFRLKARVWYNTLSVFV